MESKRWSDITAVVIEQYCTGYVSNIAIYFCEKKTMNALTAYNNMLIVFLCIPLIGKVSKLVAGWPDLDETV